MRILQLGVGDGAHSIPHRVYPSPKSFAHAHCRGLDSYDTGLDFESRGEPIGIPGVVAVRVAVGVHRAEVVVVVVIRRPLPPTRSGTSAAVAVLHFGVSVLVELILRLIVLLILVCIGACSKNLKFGQKREVVDALLHVCCYIRAVTNCVSILSHRLHHSPQVGRQSGHQGVCNRTGWRCGWCVVSNGRGCFSTAVATRCFIGTAQNVISQVTSCPATIVVVAPMVHVEILGSTCVIAIVL